MICRRPRLRRTFVPYLEGRLSARKASRLEKHLGDCGECRAELARLRAGDAAARGLRAPEEASRPRTPGISEILSDSGEPASGISGWIRRWEIRFAALTTPRAVLILAVAVLLLLVILGLLSRGLLPGRGTSGAGSRTGLGGIYHPLKVSEVAANTRPRIAVEGFVRDVSLDAEEKILRFKLVESRGAAAPFVVCEILDPAGVVVPREGDRVRVFGVARYDAQPGREWHEINPVLRLTVVQDD
jgi:hypothetical protein